MCDLKNEGFDLLKRYDKLIAKSLIQNDPKQVEVLEHLQNLLDCIPGQIPLEKKTFFKSLFSASENTIKSIYLFGEVGRGKSMLMDLFFEACPAPSKRRIHFHAFMQEVHEYIHQWRLKSGGDPIPSLATHIKKTSLILCFDEFQVTDIADAMLLSRLFTQLIKQGVIFVSTSNQHPDDLYKNGLQRELFLPFIALLKQSVEIIELDAKEDYRLTYFKSISTTFYLNSLGQGKDFLLQKFKELSNDGTGEPITLHIKGRTVDFFKSYGDILFSSFDELCNRPLGSADYIEVANEFNIIFIADIPLLTLEIRDQVRRFVTLIDALYEKKVKLICTIAISIEQLTFVDNDFDFNRTRSRLMEMQSEKYFNSMISSCD